MITTFLTTLIIICSIVLLGHLVLLGRKNESGAKDFTLSIKEMEKHVAWMIFYANPNDPRGTVPKTLGSGLTVNFRTKRNVSVFSTLFILVMISTFILFFLGKS